MYPEEHPLPPSTPFRFREESSLNLELKNGLEDAIMIDDRVPAKEGTRKVTAMLINETLQSVPSFKDSGHYW